MARAKDCFSIIRVPAIQVEKNTNLKEAWAKAEKPVYAAVEKIVNNLKNSGKNKWVDDDFGPTAKDKDGLYAFYSDGKFNKPYPDPKNCTWVRPTYKSEQKNESKHVDSSDSEEEEEKHDSSEFEDISKRDVFCDEGVLFIDGGSSNDCIQGKVGNCWLIGALSVLATRHDLLRKVFWCCDDKRMNALQEKYGIRVCRFFKDFEWYFVIIDDSLPIFSKNGKPVFAHARDKNELWVPFVEKAYAKLHGSYDSLIGGYIDGALRDLTGLIAEELVIRRGHMGFHPQNEIDLKNGSLWDKMNTYINEWGCMMGCSIQPDPVKKGSKAPKVEQKVGKTGLMMRHAYSLVDVGEITAGNQTVKLVRLRNPWGFGEWTGAWSDNSKEFKKYFEEIKAEFSGPVHRTGKGPRARSSRKYKSFYNASDTETDEETVEANDKDGTFFMTFEDWSKYYTVVFAAVDFPDSWSGLRVCGEWGQTSSGGNTTKRTWSTNPSFRFKVISKQTRIFFSLSQDDPRRQNGKNQMKEQDAIGFHIIKDSDGEKLQPPKEGSTIPGSNPSEDQAVYKLHLCVDIDVTLTKGNYIIIPSTYYENKPGPFFLNVYSDNPIALENGQLIAEEEEDGGEHKIIRFNDSETDPPQTMSRKETKKAFQFEDARSELINMLHDNKIPMEKLLKAFKTKNNQPIAWKEWKTKLLGAGVPKNSISKDNFRILSGKDEVIDGKEFSLIFKSESMAKQIYGKAPSATTGDESFAVTFTSAATAATGDEAFAVSDEESSLIVSKKSSSNLEKKVKSLERENKLLRSELELVKEEQARMMHVLLLYGKMLKCYDGPVHPAEVLKNGRSLKSPTDVENASEHGGYIEYEQPGGDEFLAVKPWKGQVFAPSNPGKVDYSAPGKEIELEWVYGYASQGTRSNLRYNSAGDVLYHTAAVGVIMSGKNSKREQRYHFGNTDDILCLDVTQDKRFAATGQIGKNPTVCIWDTSSGKNVATIGGYHTRAVIQVAFSKDGKSIITVGNDDSHNVAIYSSNSGNWDDVMKVADSKGDNNPCLFAIGTGDSKFPFVTGGVRHVLFWNDLSLTGSSSGKVKLKPRKGKAGKTPQPYPCAAALSQGPNSAVVFTGAASGSILLWQGDRVFSSVADAHSGTVNSLCAVETGKDQYLVSGGKEGLVKLWQFAENTLTPLAKIDLTSFQGDIKPRNVTVKAVWWEPEIGKLLVGTLGSEIYECSKVSAKRFTSDKVTLLMRGHCQDELWGLDTHPNNPSLFITAGDDKTVRIWDALNKTETHVAEVPDMSRAVAWSPDGHTVACGLGGRVGRRGAKNSPGGVLLLDGENLESTNKVKNKTIKSWVCDVKFSPDGKTVGVSAHDSKVWLYNSASLKKLKYNLKKSSSAVTHFDWSKDSSNIVTNDQSYELLFYDAQNGKQITKSSSMKDTQWNSETCPLSWATEGIWEVEQDGTDINSVCASHSRDLLASADDFGQVKLFRYPCPKNEKDKVQFHLGKGHSSHVTNVRFNSDDSILFSTGGNDRSIFQWRVES